MEVESELKLAGGHYSLIGNNPIKGIGDREHIVLYNLNKL
jgi:hypothetical protein